MSITQIVLEYLKVLVHPIFFLILFFALRTQIKGLLNGVNCLLEGKIVAKYGNASIELGGTTEAIDQSIILEYVKKKGGILRLEELYQYSKEKIDILQYKKEKRRINYAVEALAQQGLLVRDQEGNLSIAT